MLSTLRSDLRNIRGLECSKSGFATVIMREVPISHKCFKFADQEFTVYYRSFRFTTESQKVISHKYWSVVTRWG